MNNFIVKNKRPDMAFEIEFTNKYREYKKQCKTPTELEVRMLRVQYPAILHEIEENDLFAGRIEFGKVGLGIQNQTGGFGYYIDEEAVVKELEHKAGDISYRENLNDVLAFWKSENTTAKLMAAMPEYMRAALKSEKWEVVPMAAHPILRMAGTYLHFDKLVKIGLPGLKNEVLETKQSKQKKGEDIEIYDAMLEALDIMQDCFVFYSDMAKRMSKEEKDPDRAKELAIMADVLDKNIERAPASLREAVQLIWLYSLITPEISFGRMDIYLGDLYVHDVDNGIITDDEALRYIQNLFKIINHLDAEMDSRVIIGGCGRRNPENADRFSLVAIEACRTVKEVAPQFTLRFNSETPKDVWEASMRCLEEGRTYPLLYNDDVYVPAMMHAMCVSRELAEQYIPLGCGEMEIDHYSIHTPSGAFNSYKALELAIFGGYDPIARWKVGPQTKPLVECATFDEFLESYKKHIDYYVQIQADFEKLAYDVTGSLHTFLYAEMLYDNAIESGKGMFSGGVALHGTLELFGCTNAANSLTAIKELIFDRRKLTAEQLIEAMENNFKGFERERKLLLEAPKYGNDDPIADDMLLMLHDYICNKIRDQAERVGLGSYLAVSVNNGQNTTCGRWVGAMPDGRTAGTAMANANGPMPGTDKNGITALLNSIGKPNHNITAGMVQNVRFSRETFTNSREKVSQLVDNYFEKGGAQLMITVVSKDQLAKAMEHPEDYRDLMVRVGGFSARFVDLNKDIQREVYMRETY